MNGVKGLIIKEIYLRRRTLLSELAVFILLFVLAVSFCLSFDYGNMKNNENLNPDSAVILAYAVAGVGIMIFTVNAETAAKDAKCKWNIFERTLPLSAKKLAAVKICLILGSNLLGTAVSAALSAVIFTLAHQKFALETMANITAIALTVFIFITVMHFLLLKFNNPQKAALALSGIIIALYVLFMAWIYQRSDIFAALIDAAESSEIDPITLKEFLEPIINLRDRLFPFSIPIFAAIAVIGYFLFLTQYKRREK